MASEPVRLERSLDAMGSTYTIVAYGENRGRMEAAFELAFEEVRRLDRMLSNYRPDSELSQVNRWAADGPVPVSDELFGLLQACVEYSRRSEGAFDITVGRLMKTWGFYRGSGRMPHRAEMRGALAQVGYRHLVLDASTRTVRFAVRGLEIDPGGIGKGYAVDRMATILKQNGVSSAFLSAGGSSLYAIGAPPGEPKGWRVDIKHPKDRERAVATVHLKDESMSTSGNYEKFFWANGRLYSHIFDPRTGMPAEGVLSASVVAPRTLDSEAWTKPFYVNGRAWGMTHQPQGFRVFLCENRSEAPCAWLP